MVKKNSNTEHNVVDAKAKEYHLAIEKYHAIAWYSRVEIFSSVVVVSLQVATLIKLFENYTGTNVIAMIATIIFAYIIADFISGIAHMIGDSNTHYTSIIGPFIAVFHLHHSRLIYKNKHPIKIYFYESGQKFWMILYLSALLIMQSYGAINFCSALFLVAIGILSSVAELSHFWCHNKAQCNIIVQYLQKYRILLSMKHHGFHHRNDNTHYAFLNGMTDPLVNLIAYHFCKGYKNHADLHLTIHGDSQNN